MQLSFGSLAIAACLLTSVSAHMKMKTPAPYGASTLNNSPLAADGSDFPCKQRSGVYDAEGASNVMAIGESQTLSFIGSATHGGGSCQVALTSDLQPTKNSKWMVIKSIEGGCPTSAAGNIGDNPDGTGASTFQYTIPEGVAPGEYTIAWAWFNKVGNREMYMNCGPATVTGAKKKRYNPNPVVRRQSSFPDLYVANLAGVNTCKTTEGSDYTYPNPGDDAQKVGNGPFLALDASCGGGGSGPAQQPAAGAPASGSTAASAPAATDAPAPAAISPVATPAPAPSPDSGSPGVFATGAGAAPAAAAPTPAADPAPAAPAAPAAAPAPATGASGAQTAGAACSDEGAWACSADGSSFQRCASGTWSVAMSVPAGLSASCGDATTGFSMIPKVAGGAGKMKRVVRKSEGLFEPYSEE